MKLSEKIKSSIGPLHPNPDKWTLAQHLLIGFAKDVYELETKIERLERKGNLAFEATLIEKYLDDLDGRKGFTLTPEIRRWIRRAWLEIAAATLLQGGDDE